MSEPVRPPPGPLPSIGGAVGAGFAVALPWAAAEVVSFALRTRLVFAGGDVPLLLLTVVLLCTAIAVLAALAGTWLGRRTGRAMPLSRLALWPLAAASATFLLSVLVREPIPGRSGDGMPGGFAGAVVISLVLPGVALVATSLAPHRRWVPAAWFGVLLVAMQFLPAHEPGYRKGQAPAGSPNVLLITIDTLRADHVGAIGGGPTDVRTPRMDRLASEGVLFTQAQSHIPITGPSHTSILSGARPWTHETLINGVALKPGIANLPEALAGKGYRTGAFVSAFVLDGDFGYGRGFDTYDDEFYPVKGLYDTSPMRLWYQARIRLWLVDDIERRGDETTDQALRWLEANKEHPFFLWVHLYDPHGTYEPPPPYDKMYYQGNPRDPAHRSMGEVKDLALYFQKALKGITDIQWVLAQYKGEVSFTDAQVGRILDAVDNAGVRDKTLVYLLADHGESLTEHGYYFNHGAQLHDPDLHIPMMVRFPDRVPAGVRVDGLVDASDVTPTILDLLGQPGWPMEGRSLKGLWQGQGAPTPQSESMCFDREANKAGGMWRYKMVSLRTAGARYVCHEAGGDELYDLANDPGENADISTRPDQTIAVQAFSAACQRLLAGSKGAGDRSNTSMSAEQCEKLKALGYIENAVDCAEMGQASVPPGGSP